MVNYQDSKVYEIVCRKTGERYIGSTTQPLSSRLNDHRKTRRKTASSAIIERGDYYINLLENWSCDNLEQLLKKEREWYDKIECINKHRPHTTHEERLEQWRISTLKKYQLNKDAINENRKRKMVCECGVEHRIAEKSRHLKTCKSNYIKQD